VEIVDPFLGDYAVLRGNQLCGYNIVPSRN
jgi:hypothetical protein